jgi:hypothetical protein
MKENVKGPEMDKSGSKVYAIRNEDSPMKKTNSKS